jgi:hypothetical protein
MREAALGASTLIRIHHRDTEAQRGTELSFQRTTHRIGEESAGSTVPALRISCRVTLEIGVSPSLSAPLYY